MHKQGWQEVDGEVDGQRTCIRCWEEGQQVLVAVLALLASGLSCQYGQVPTPVLVTAQTGC